MESKKVSINMNSNLTSWSKTITDGKLTRRVEVQKVENGYIITMNKYGRPTEKSDYIDETKKYISKTNPLEDKVIVNEEKSGTKSEGKKVKSEEEVNNDILKIIQGDTFTF